MAAESIRIALAQYPIGRPDSFDEYAAKLREWIMQAAASDAALLVFPEYGAMELASVSGAEVEADLARQISEVASLAGDVDDLHASLAHEFSVYILAASMPVKTGTTYVNRARLFGPKGGRGHQDKTVMTRFENEQWSVSPGKDLQLFETALGRIGVCICYDIEFPLMARALCQAGAELLLVPSCTDTAAGYHRVRTGALARALENQCHVVISPTVGNAPWLPSVDFNTGAAGIYGPADEGFPASGIVVEGHRDEPGWIYGEIDPARMEKARAEGQVFNYRDWRLQPGADTLHLPAPLMVRVG